MTALLMSGKFWASIKNKSSKLHLWNILNPLGMEQKPWVRDRVRLRNGDLGIIWEVNLYAIQNNLYDNGLYSGFSLKM